MKRVKRIAGIAAALGLAAAACAGASEFRWHLPAGFPEPWVPADNPMSDAKVALGEKLFADKRLSVTGQHSCQSCHSPERAFTDGLPRSLGATGAALPLNAPTLLNVAYNSSLGWSDAKLRTLEQQMRGPLFNEHPQELGLAGREADLVRQLSADGAMAREFAAAFPDEPTAISMDNVIRAVAAYERTLFAGHSAFDRYVFSGEHRALSDRQKSGMALFFSGRTGCAGCHGGVNFAGAWVDREHPGAEPVFADTGTGVAVRVPTLRNLPATAPYMHDGRFATIDAVLDHYEQLAVDPGADPKLRRAPLTTIERDALREFLLSLADSR